jgi:hypothetical protein
MGWILFHVAVGWVGQGKIATITLIMQNIMYETFDLLAKQPNKKCTVLQN